MGSFTVRFKFCAPFPFYYIWRKFLFQAFPVEYMKLLFCTKQEKTCIIIPESAEAEQEELFDDNRRKISEYFKGTGTAALGGTIGKISIHRVRPVDD